MFDYLQDGDIIFVPSEFFLFVAGNDFASLYDEPWLSGFTVTNKEFE